MHTRSFTNRVLLILTILIVAFNSQEVKAYNPPVAPADTFYAVDNWNTTVAFNGANRKLAYRIGYNADQGNYYSYIILAFGRQFKHSSQGWGVDLAGTNGGFKSEQWVKDVANAFISGFAANPAHDLIQRDVRLIVGTSNGNEAWQCNNATNQISADWNIAGQRWGNVVKGIPDKGAIYVRGGNDIESWDDSFTSGWTACGAGAVSWMNGYFTNTTRNHYNFGSNAYIELPTQWTQAQLYNVSYGLPYAYTIPLMYCASQAPGWVSMRQTYSSLRFDGVTSENAAHLTCTVNGTQVLSLSWEASWTTFNNALNNAGYPNILLNSVSSFCYVAGSCSP